MIYIFKNNTLQIILIAFLLLFSFNVKAKTTLNIWSFTDELITNGAVTEYEKLYPNVKIKFTIVALENYMTKLKPALRRPSLAPDIFLAEVSIVKELVNSKYYMPLTNEKDITSIKDDYVPYAWNLGVDKKGTLRALTWQATPGGFYYRRSYAKKYLGSDDPKVVAEAISTWDKFLETARKIKQASGGTVKIVGGGDDLYTTFASNKKNSFIKNNKLYIDPKIIQWLEIYKTLYQEDLTDKTKQFTPPWMNGLKQGIFGYFLPTWGLHYVLKENAPKTSGDWAITNATEAFFRGGTWVGIYYKTKHKKEALDFLKMQTVNKDYMLNWAKKTGDLVSRISIQKQLTGLTEPFLNNQKHYEFFMNEAATINSDVISKYDRAVDMFIQEESLQYANGSQDLKTTLDNVKKKVFNAYRF